LTVLRLDLPPTLARTFRSTNAIESMISISRDHASNVKRWRGGNMTLRWCAAGMVEAQQQFRRVNWHLHLAGLRTALEREPPRPSDPSVMMRRSTQPDHHRAATEVPRNSGQPPGPLDY
jgi:putative transposase